MTWSDGQIREYWNQQAKKHKQSPSASWSDHHVIELEIRAIRLWLGQWDNVLDIGCANGYSTTKYAKRWLLRIKGIDYSSEMIAEAKKRLNGVCSNIIFEEGDILSLKEEEGCYDKIICTRVIINLGSWERQVRALKALAKPLKKGGTLLLSEATIQGWQKLNAFLKETDSAEIPMPPFNLYLDEEAVKEVMADDFEFCEIINFASSYYVGTRVFKRFISRDARYIMDPMTHMNRFMSKFPAIGDYGIQKLFVFRKK